jgi:hypothetical protein
MLCICQPPAARRGGDEFCSSKHLFLFENHLVSFKVLNIKITTNLYSGGVSRAASPSPGACGLPIDAARLSCLPVGRFGSFCGNDKKNN